MALTEEEIRDMEARQAWEASLAPVQRRVETARGETINVNDLPNAPPEAAVSRAPAPEPNYGPPSDEELRQYGATDRDVAAARRFNAPDDKAAPSSPVRNPEWSPDKEKAPPAKTEAKKEEAPPADADDDGASGPSSPGVYVPGGMSPYTEKRDVKHGKVVAPGVRDALGAAGHLQLEAGGRERAANEHLYQQEHDAAIARMHANESAMAQQQRLAEDRDRMVSARLAEIEVLNKKAQGKPEDLWSSTHVLGRMVGFLALTLGTVQMATGGKGGAASGIALAMGGKFIDGLINQDIQAKVDERRQAGKAAGREINLLHLHEERFKNQQKAIDATKLAYYDNVLQQMEAYKADHAGEVNEAKYLDLQAQILKEQADVANRLGKQEQADVTDEILNKYREGRFVGGSGAGGHKEPDFVVTTPNGVSYAFPNKEAQNKYIATVEEKQRLIRINNEIAGLREEAKKLPAVSGPEGYYKHKSLVKRIEELEQNKLKAIESAEKQGVLREGEYERAKATTGHATGGLGLIRGVPIVGHGEQKVADDVIASQTARWSKDLEEAPHAASAPIVKRRFAKNPASGELEENTVKTGQFSKPMQGLAPRGSESRDPDRPAHTAERPASETTPKAPRVAYPKDLPAPAAHHSRKKKK